MRTVELYTYMFLLVVSIKLNIFLACFFTLYFQLLAVVLSNVYPCFLTNKGIIIPDIQSTLILH